MPDNFSRIKLPPGRSMSGDLILQRRGGDMWEDLAKWIKQKDEDPNFYHFFPVDVIDKMKEIEKEYGVT